MSGTVAFAVRGDNLSARYAPGGAAPGNINGVQQVSSSDAGVIGTGYLDMSQSLGPRGLSWPAKGNFPTDNKFSVLLRMALIGTGTEECGLWALGQSQQIGTALAVFQDNTLFQDSESLTAINDIGLNNGPWTPVIGQYYDIVYIFDMTSTAANSLQIYVDTTLIATNNNVATWGSSRSVEGFLINLGIGPGATLTRMRVNEFTIFDGIIDPTAVQLTNGVGALNGASRTAFVQSSALDGSVYTDPGTNNVVAGTGYEFAGVSLLGTFKTLVPTSEFAAAAVQSNNLSGWVSEQRSTTIRLSARVPQSNNLGARVGVK